MAVDPNIPVEPASMSPSSFRDYLAPLLNMDDLSQASIQHIRNCLLHILRPHCSSAVQTGAFLAALRTAKLDRNAEVIAAAASIMRELYVPAHLDPARVWVDIVGTGGDGKDTFNVSTSAAIVAAGAGCYVAKHGNRASSSTSGSADLLQSLNVPVTILPPKKMSAISKSCPFLFLFAPLYHPALGHLAPLRKEMGARTIFNILGPLINPGNPRVMIIGVPTPEYGPIFAQSLLQLNVKRAWVVCGHEGLDEISISGPTHVWQVEEQEHSPASHPSNNTDSNNNTHPIIPNNNSNDNHHLTSSRIKYFDISPSDFGLQAHLLTSVSGSKSSGTNAATLSEMLDNKLPHNDPIENFVIINAAALLIVGGVVPDGQYARAVEVARQSISSGKALEALDTFRTAADRATACSCAQEQSCCCQI